MKIWAKYKYYLAWQYFWILISWWKLGRIWSNKYLQDWEDEITLHTVNMYDLVPPAPIGRPSSFVQVDMDHRWLWQNFWTIETFAQEWMPIFWLIESTNTTGARFHIRNTKNYFKHNLSGAQSGIHLLDLPPPLRSPIFRSETQNRATTHLSQVPITTSRVIGHLNFSSFMLQNLRKQIIECLY